ncbi:DUF2569 family protein [Methylovirgula sp. 4M-Z18]|uniref:DUF2569 family protein n=1 Tax=Methylovirgula sp. 4M-Z18 TaxID=2293567 RepID=UPI000E2E8FF1|nr:DUF2569 family protein [Methylovirgula sp. 4M-Z18]RFB80477.1 DUF2569 family protein [Methylovirgula sp. 4M-Z18]
MSGTGRIEIKNELRGVSGWLMFAVLYLFLTGLGNVYLAFVSLNSSDPSPLALPFPYMAAKAIAAMGFAVFGWYCAIRLASEKPNAPKVTIAYYGILLGVTSFFALVSYSTIRSLAAEAGFDSFVYETRTIPIMFQLIGVGAECIIWMMYFSKSKRVKNTYSLNNVEAQSSRAELAAAPSLTGDK